MMDILHSESETVPNGCCWFSFLPRDASAERGDATVSRPSVRDVQVSATHRLEFSENNFTAE